MSTNVESKSILAKLLATENLVVQNDPNSYTASFQPTSRVLSLPPLNDKYDEDYIYDGFIQHEISHALWTPVDFSEYEGFNEVPFALVNVLEDIRIERLVKELYPGTKKVFSRFYKFIMDNDFFSIGDKDVGELPFLDRLNVYSKVGPMSGIKLTDFEAEIYNRSLKNETFQDVIDLSKELVDLVESDSNDLNDLIQETKEAESGEQQEGSGQSQTKSESSESGEEGQQSDQKDESEDGESKEGQEDSEGESDSNQQSDEEGEDDSSSSVKDGEGVDSEALQTSETHDSLNQNMKDEFVAEEDKYVKSAETYFVGEAEGDEFYMPTKEVLKENEDRINEFLNTAVGDGIFKSREEGQQILENVWKDFKEENKHIVNSMVKEFEMKKSADESRRTKIDDSGQVDPRKLKDYKISEDIFKKNMTVEAGKNHGIIMFVDFSGSMDVRLEDTVKQIIIMIMFARKVGLPFEVYSFTNYGKPTYGMFHDNADNYALTFKNKKGLEEVGNVFSELNNQFLFKQLISSNMKKKDIEQAMKYMYLRSAYHSVNKYLNSGGRYYFPVKIMSFETGGTPLNLSILASEKLINRFKKNNNIQICNTIFLTDGMSDTIDWHTNQRKSVFALNNNIGSNRYNIIVDTKTNKKYQLNDFVETGKSAITESIVMYSIIKERVDTNLLIYFIGSNASEVRGHYYRDLPDLKNRQKMDGKELKEKMKYGIVQTTLSGKDEYFIIDDNKLKTSNIDLENLDTDKKVTSQFKAQSKNKKNSRVFAKKILDVISKEMS